MTYIASLTFPFRTCSFVFKVQAAETGMTGMRDALIANKLISENMDSWSADPYDKDFMIGALMNKSEQDVYDSKFPDHPLTRARQIIKQIEMSLQWKPVIEKLPAFEK